VAHPNCQQHLTSIWYGPQMGFMQSLNLWKKLLMWVVCVPLMPLFCIVYIIAPDCKVKTLHATAPLSRPPRIAVTRHAVSVKILSTVETKPQQIEVIEFEGYR